MNPLRSLRSVVRFRRPEWNPTKRRLAKAANIDDLRAVAKRRLPGGVFDYIDGGAEDEVTYRRNRSAFDDIEFVPRVLRDVGQVDTSTSLMGVPIPMPLVLAPTGFTRIAHPQGELAVARSAEKAGIPYCLSSLGTRSIEDVRSVSGGDLWFQVYVWRDKGLLAELLERAAAARYSTIVITVDTAVLGRRERDVRRGFTLPPKIGFDTIFSGILHPGWTAAFLRSEPIVFANVAGRSVGDGTDPVSLADYVNTLFDPSLSWDDIAWFRDRWPGNVVLKGIQSVPDAKLAAGMGLDAIALSNHGGRQLDGAPAPITLVDPVRQAIGDDAGIICDGGVRRGGHILRGVALGADACMTGRPYLYGLAAGGEAGVDQVLSQFDSELRRALALTGCTTVSDVDASLVRRIH
ncbi:MAG: alpha-hydroxy acid oxidase [Candidatus Binatia bacterium]